ncbi:MAG TPA: GH116 family glycosyl hydrolase [Longimicrobiales bacterium]|nr:GH116 family glycosyl hydrolase [Longimicrobiales bacterium]
MPATVLLSRRVLSARTRFGTLRCHRPDGCALRPSLLLLLLVPTTLAAQVPDRAAPPGLGGLPKFSLERGSSTLSGLARPWGFLADVGRRAALLGNETGALEAWVWPRRLARDLELRFRLPELDSAIAGTGLARQVEVHAEGATVVYSHAGFTVRQHWFVPLDEPGALILLEIESVRPLSVTVRVDPDLEIVGLEGFGGGTISWQPVERRFLLTQGTLRTHHAFIGSPFAVRGSAQSQGKLPAAHSEFALEFDRATAASNYIPIVIAGAASRDSADLVYRRLLADAPRYWSEKLDHYRRVQQELLRVETPDARFNQAFEWSKVIADQQLVCNPGLGCAPAPAPGRELNVLDAAMLGQFGTVRSALLFLSSHQEADGRIRHPATRLHEFSNDATPFFINAIASYWRASNDVALVRQLWSNVVRAFQWCAGTDTNHDGLVESSPGQNGVNVYYPDPRVRSDIYDAAVWVAALDGLRALARVVGDTAVSREAGALYSRGSQTLEQSFWVASAGIHGSALLQASSDSMLVDRGLSVWPAAALSLGVLEETRAESTLRALGSAVITSDWGPRLRSRDAPDYDPLHPGKGAVWSFATSFTALAHFRYHRGWAGYDLVRDVTRATFDFGRGRVPEILSGEFYNAIESARLKNAFGTSLLIAPVMLGLFGIEPDAPNRAVAIEPHLPAEWNTARVANLRVGADRLSVEIERQESRYAIELRRTGSSTPLFVRLSPALPLGARVERVRVDDRDAVVHTEATTHDVHPVVEIELTSEATIEIDFAGGLEVIAPLERLEIGDGSSGLKVLDFSHADRDYTLVLEGAAGASYSLALRSHVRARAVTGAEIVEQTADRLLLRVRFPAAGGPFVRRVVVIRT